MNKMRTIWCVHASLLEIETRRCRHIDAKYVVLRQYCILPSLRLFQDHINFTIGRQSLGLKQLENSTLAFKHLLTRDSRQTLSQQITFIKEYIQVFKVCSRSPFSRPPSALRPPYARPTPALRPPSVRLLPPAFPPCHSFELFEQ